jgi:hypothetical protein
MVQIDFVPEGTEDGKNYSEHISDFVFYPIFLLFIAILYGLYLLVRRYLKDQREEAEREKERQLKKQLKKSPLPASKPTTVMKKK